MVASSNEAGSAAATAEVNKTLKYNDIISGVDFVPVAIETSGVWGRQAFELVNKIGRRIATLTHEPRSTAFLRQRISVAVQRGNAFLILSSQAASLIVVNEHEQLHYLSLTVHLGVYTTQYCCNFVCLIIIIIRMISLVSPLHVS